MRKKNNNFDWGKLLKAVMIGVGIAMLASWVVIFIYYYLANNGYITP